MVIDLLLRRMEVVADGVVLLTLCHPAGDLVPEWEPGAHIDLVLADDLVRQYSLCGDPADRRTLQVAVLREPAGRGGSAYVHERLAEDDKVRVRGPRNNFPLVPARAYRFVAGGIGITPILPMLAAVDAPWQLTYGGRTRASMAFLDRLARYGDRVRVYPQDEFGLLDLDEALGPPDPDTAVYCCGPEPLLAAVEQRCAAWPADVLHIERFAAPVVDRVAGAFEAFEVELANSDRTLPVPADRSILQVLEEAGVPVLSSCREGTCGTCETGVLAGVPDHRDCLLTEAERAAGDVMMLCVSRSLTPKLRLDL